MEDMRIESSGLVMGRPDIIWCWKIIKPSNALDMGFVYMQKNKGIVRWTVQCTCGNFRDYRGCDHARFMYSNYKGHMQSFFNLYMDDNIPKFDVTVFNLKGLIPPIEIKGTISPSGKTAAPTIMSMIMEHAKWKIA